MAESIHPAWRRSSYSTSHENCVEVAALPTRLALRDSKDPYGPVLIVSPRAFRQLAQAIRREP